MDWGGGFDGLVLSTRHDAVILETDVEAFVRVTNPESVPETEADFISFDCMDKASVPLPSLGCLHRLHEDLIADQHTGTLFRQTGDRKAKKIVNVWPHSKREKYGQMEGVPIFNPSIRYVELLEVSPVCLLVRWHAEYLSGIHTRF